MKSLLISSLILAGFFSYSANAEENMTFSAGASTFAEIQNFSNSSGYENEYSFKGLQAIGSVNFNDNAQLMMTIYSAKEDEYSFLKVSGNTLRINLGKGFQKKGLKAYGSLGLFRETLENTNSDFKEKVSGFELGAAIGYNFEVVSVDWGFTIRDSSAYEKEGIVNSDTDVIATTGYLSLTANF